MSGCSLGQATAATAGTVRRPAALLLLAARQRPLVLLVTCWQRVLCSCSVTPLLMLAWPESPQVTASVTAGNSAGHRRQQRQLFHATVPTTAGNSASSHGRVRDVLLRPLAE